MTAKSLRCDHFRVYVYNGQEVGVAETGGASTGAEPVRYSYQADMITRGALHALSAREFLFMSLQLKNSRMSMSHTACRALLSSQCKRGSQDRRFLSALATQPHPCTLPRQEQTGVLMQKNR